MRLIENTSILHHVGGHNCEEQQLKKTSRFTQNITQATHQWTGGGGEIGELPNIKGEKIDAVFLPNESDMMSEISRPQKKKKKKKPSPSSDSLETEHGCSKNVDVQAATIDVAPNDDVMHISHECHNTSDNIEDHFANIKLRDLTSNPNYYWVINLISNRKHKCIRDSVNGFSSVWLLTVKPCIGRMEKALYVTEVTLRNMADPQERPVKYLGLMVHTRMHITICCKPKSSHSLFDPHSEALKHFTLTSLNAFSGDNVILCFK